MAIVHGVTELDMAEHACRQGRESGLLCSQMEAGVDSGSTACCLVTLDSLLLLNPRGSGAWRLGTTDA